MIATFANQLTASEVWSAVLDVATEGPLQVRRAARLLEISEDEVRQSITERAPEATEDARHVCDYLWARYRLRDETIATYADRDLDSQSTAEDSGQ